MKKKCQIVMLPGNEKSYLIRTKFYSEQWPDGYLYCDLAGVGIDWNCDNYEQLYILSNDEIKYGDWSYNDVLKTISKNENSESQLVSINANKHNHKIIATTDNTISKPVQYNVENREAYPRPSNEFIEQFAKNFHTDTDCINEVFVDYESPMTKICAKCSTEYPMSQGDCSCGEMDIKSYGKDCPIVNPDNTLSISLIKKTWHKEDLPIQAIKDCIKYCEEQQIYDKLSTYNNFYYKLNKWIKDNYSFE